MRRREGEKEEEKKGSREEVKKEGVEKGNSGLDYGSQSHFTCKY
jgi:hypothetical protein